jgi:predicted O-linked N-acetylglucosamine transferase (SPINDLY family)
MGWIKRIWHGTTPDKSAPATADADALLRAAYECETQGDPAGAERFYRQAMECDGGHADARYFLSRIAAWDRRYGEAALLLQSAVESNADEALYRRALGGVLLDTRQFEAALEELDACLRLQPDCLGVQLNRAVALVELQRGAEALVDLERLREVMDEVPQVHFNLGGLYKEFGRTAESIAAYRRALRVAPDNATLHSNLLLVMNYSDELSAADIHAEHLRYGERFSRRYASPRPDRRWPRRLRIGYVSPDLHGHVVTYFLEPLLANHDRSKFEVFCYHTHLTKDATTERLRSLAAQWRDCEDLSDAQLAELVREDAIDILVDLAGHTGYNRLPAFAMKPAPVQVTYLGYPNTTGLGAVDYHLTDAYADPPEADRYSVERPLRLPGSYFCYRPFPNPPEVGPPPFGARGFITFGCFNHFSKISRSFLLAVAEILRAVPGSRFFLKCRPLGIAAVEQSVRQVFAEAGIERDRIDLRGWEARYANHLTAYNEVDIALDSFPYNGATTTCEAIWMGVPVVTLVGDRHAGRMGLSLLSALGLDELVAHNNADYVRICADLASDGGRLARLRESLRQTLRGSRLLDESRFTRGLEAAYTAVWEKALQEADAPALGQQSPAQVVNRARMLRESGKPADAADACKEILRGQPDNPEALALLWDLGFECGMPGLSLDCLVKAISLDGSVAQFHYMLGCVLQAQGKSTDAIASFQRAVQIDPGLAKAHSNLGWALELSGRVDLAVECYRDAVRNDPALVQPLYNLGNALKQLGDLEQAATYMKQAIAKEPRRADWLCNLASLHFQRLELDEALSAARAALEIDPAEHRAHSQLGMALVILGRVDEALAAFARALDINPRAPDLESCILHVLHYRDAEDEEALGARHRAWSDKYARGVPRMTSHRRARRGWRRLNIGYVSPDFARHPVASFIEPALDSHDREAFSVFCYFSAKNGDDVTERLRGKCDHWRDIAGSSDADVADRIRADGIDLLVDLAGHTQGGRPNLFARKPAPVQVNWLGYPDTTGLATMDYRLTDAIADPEGSDDYCTEELVRLEGGFLCFRPPSEAVEPGEPPSEKRGHVTFGCFNNLAKITPDMIALWARLLRAVPDARLVFKTHGLAAQSARSALALSFEAQGIAASRIEALAYEWTSEAHLARYGEIDVGLDVFPYNGTTTTCEALWMGVPVVTLAGKSHAARVGASILSHAGLSELIASSADDYVEKARALASDGAWLRRLRLGMRERLRASTLIDARRFTRTLEEAYRRLWAAQAGPR